MSEAGTTVVEVILEGESHLITFYDDELEAVGEDILVYYAWMEDGLLNVSATLRGDESPVTEGYEWVADGPWFIHERTVATT